MKRKEGSATKGFMSKSELVIVAVEAITVITIGVAVGYAISWLDTSWVF